jgi:chromosome segregation ATPase
MSNSAEIARRQAGIILRHGANNSEELISKAATLELSVDQAVSDTARFRHSFTDAQEATLKAPAKKLARSGAAVSKSVKNLSRQLEQIPPDPARVLSAVSSVQKALEAMQSEQRALGKEMGVPVH